MPAGTLCKHEPLRRGFEAAGARSAVQDLAMGADEVAKHARRVLDKLA